MSKFDAWLKTAKPGDQFIYHDRRGPLMNSPLIYAVRLAHDDGLIDLVQKRTEKPRNKDSRGEEGVGRFQYIAIMRGEIEHRIPSDWQTRPIGRLAA